SAAVGLEPGSACRLLESGGKRGTDRVREADMRNDPVAEERVRPVARPVQELLRNDGVARRQFLLEASDRGGREQRVAAQELEAEDVGPVIDLRGAEHVPAAVPRKK